MRRHLFALALFLASTLYAQNSKTQWLSSPAEAARIDRVEQGLPPISMPGEDPIRLDLLQSMRDFQIPGLSIAVFHNGRIVWAKTYGVIEAGKEEPVTLDTLFQAGSISKPVAVLAALHYVEAGKFSLDENVNDKLTSWKIPENEFTKDQKVTLRRIMSHSAGTTVHGFPGYAVNEPRPTLIQVLDGEKPANTAAVRVDMAPGTKFRYSGGGTSIMQLLMVDVLKKPFPQIMEETVIRPLGLKHSSYQQPLPSDWAAQTATGHRADGRIVEGRWHIYPEMAAAGLWTTPTDLAQIAIEVAKSKAGKSNRVISQAMTRQMLTAQVKPVGLGFFLDPESKSDQFGHGGADEGFQASLVAFSDSGSGVAIMANSDNGFTIFDRITASLAKEYGWTSFTPQDMALGFKLILITNTKGVDRAIADYKKLKADSSNRDLGPADLNALGYMLMRNGKLPDAIKVFQANIAVYPEDSNAYDSLGEAYMNAGRKEAAISNYRKSLQLDPKNDNAVKMLQKLDATVDQAPH